MKNYLIIQKTGPFANYNAQEGIEFAMALASFEQNVTLLFIGDGCWQLCNHSSTPVNYAYGTVKAVATLTANAIDNAVIEANTSCYSDIVENFAIRKAFHNNLKALRLTGITAVYANKFDCESRGIDPQDAITEVTTIDQFQQLKIMSAADIILSF